MRRRTLSPRKSSSARVLFFRFIIANTLCLLFAAIPLHAGLFSYNFPGATAEELALEKPLVDPEASVEYLERHIRAHNPNGCLTIDYYARLKIYDTTGAKELSDLEIEFAEEDRSRRVDLRILSPDGTITEIERDAIFRREVFRDRETRRERASVALPKLFPGAIIEVHYQVERSGKFPPYWIFAHVRFPTRLLKIYVDFFRDERWIDVAFAGFPKEWVRHPGNDIEVRMENLPAYMDEAFSPTRSSIMPWFLIYRKPSLFFPGGDRSFWELVSIGLDRWQEESFQESGPIREKTHALIAGLTMPEAKLRALENFCRREIQLLDPESKDLPDDVASTLKRSAGTGTDRALLFASMAQIAGFEVRLALCDNHSEVAFSPMLKNFRAIPDLLVAIHDTVSDTWSYHDLISSHLTYGQLNAENSGAVVVVGDEDGGTDFKSTPIAPAEDNLATRIGMFEIDEEGSLEGRGYFKFSGLLGVSWRRFLDDSSYTESMERIRTLFDDLFGDYELDSVEVSALNRDDEPLRIDFILRVPHYAQATGSRLFFAPCVFEPEGNPLFAAPERKYPVEFPFPWKTFDRIKVTYPEGFAWADDAPPGGLGEIGQVSHRLTYWHDAEKHVFVFQRELVMGLLSVGVESYDGLRRIFHDINEADRFPLTLKATTEQP